ncbi:MAG: glycosyltransferase family 2 protein [Anaerolineales bacterium]|nr:glycosyltransferase family 2 protein [Anaerolineales bacterium]
MHAAAGDPPKVSVIIPTFNRAGMVQQAIASVLAQTYTDFECIVVDDGSPDDTQASLQPLVAAGRIRYVRQANAGLSAARNHGIRVARGAYITFLDDDDLYEPEKLAQQAAYLDTHPEAMLVHCWFTKFSEEQPDLGLRKPDWFQGWLYPAILSYWRMLMATPCLMLRREVFDVVGSFDESLRAAEDLDMWRRIARHYAFHMVPESLVRIRQQAVSMSSDKTRAAGHFRIMLDKAFTDDPQLSPITRRQALAAMYTSVAQNLLGEGGLQEIRVARQHLRTAIGLQPLAPGAWLTLAASLLPRRLRSVLAGAVRRLRFRRQP